MEKKIICKPIGTIKSPFKSSIGMPIQPKGALGIKGKVIVKKRYSAGLKDLAGFSHIILIYYFHLASKYALEVKPYMGKNFHGVFATRAPARPNALGISIVKLTNICGNILEIEDVDIIDNTPLLDIKPYVPDFDVKKVKRVGWLKNNIHKLKKAKDDGRFLNKDKANRVIKKR